MAGRRELSEQQNPDNPVDPVRKNSGIVATSLHPEVLILENR